MTDEKAHATLSASGAARWMNCPGSIQLSEGIEAPTSPYALEGTAAHALAEQCLQDAYDPEDYIGHRIMAGEHGIVTEDMADAVSVYVEYVRGVIGLADHHEIERRIRLSDWDTDPDGIGQYMFGTADFMAYRAKTHTLLIADYKHGAGIPVEAEGNPQMRYYAAGAVSALQAAGYAKPERIRTVIVQPRAVHAEGTTRRDEFSIDFLKWWVNFQLMPAAYKTEDPNPELNPGSWCHFCPAAAVCPALKADAQAKAKIVFTDEGRAQPEKPIEQLSRDEIAQILSAKKDIQAWLNSVEKYAHEELQQGREIPGHKLVAARAQRRWLDEDKAADRLCEAFGLGNEDIFDKPKMLSPAQVEKVVGKSKAAKSVLDELYTAESTGTTVAPATDKRPAITPTTAQEAFADTDSG